MIDNNSGKIFRVPLKVEPSANHTSSLDVNRGHAGTGTVH